MTPVATRLTRATGDCLLRRVLFRPPLLRPDEEDFREDLRPPPFLADDLRPAFRADDFLPDDLRAPPLRLELERFRAPPFRPPLLLRALLRPPLFRPDDPDRELFRRRELLDFLAAAIGKLHVGGFVERIARFEHTMLRYTGSARNRY